jgi:hypothetical protein
LTLFALHGKVIAGTKEATIMDLGEAPDRINVIHSHLARSETYRGYRPLALALSGVVGLLAALFQPASASGDPLAFVWYWVTVALVCAALAGCATIHGYLFREDELARRRTRIIARQFLPCLFAGVAVTVVLVRPEWRSLAVPLLPPLWALLFFLGIVASLPYLPRAASLVAAWYFLAAVVIFSQGETVLGGWAVGVPFWVGQLLAAGVLVAGRNREPSA